MTVDEIVRVSNVSKIYLVNRQVVKAIQSIDLKIIRGEFVGILGESGSGKTTLAHVLAGLEMPTHGVIQRRARVHMVFQNPVESFDPRIKIGKAIMEGMRNNGVKYGVAYKKMIELLEECGLCESYTTRYPHELSGGECQRAAIARALACEPDLLICDEATSALDLIVQKQMITLIQQIKRKRNITIIFISHDILLLQSICSRLLVMHHGEIVENGEVKDIMYGPKSTHTMALLTSMIMLTEKEN